MNWLKTTTSAENAPFSGGFGAATKRAMRSIAMKTSQLVAVKTD
jgi:hypothetical protein